MANRFFDQLANALVNRLTTLRKRADDVNTKSAAGTVTAREIEGLHGELVTWDQWFTEATATGVATPFQAYVRDNLVPPDQTFELNTLVASVNTNVTTAGAWIINTSNLDRVGGFPAAKKPTASGFEDKVYSSNDTTGLQTALTGVITAIDLLGVLLD